MTSIKTAAVGTCFLFSSLFILPSIQLNAQNVGIGTTNPLARFHVADSSVLFIAPGTASLSPGNPPFSGAGRRLMWYADKAAFRTGYIDGTQWDMSNIGYYSFASGYDNMANGGFSTATGGGTTAGGAYSFTANYATITSGLGSTAFGYRTTAKAHGGMALGALNDDTDSPDPFNPASSDRLFQIGNGNVNTLAKNNVMTVLRNGNTGFGTTSPTSLVHIRQGSAGGTPPFGPLSVETNSAAYIGLLTPDASESGVIFGTNSNNASGGIVYNNVSDQNGLQFRTNGNTNRMVINNAGNVGIGTTAPNFPLNFSSALGDKIALWGNTAAHYGLGIQSLLLQIYTDAASSDIAFGYGSSSSFTETMRIKGNGAIAVNGDAGQAGQVLTSSGPSQSPQWKNGSKYFFFERAPGGVVDITTSYAPIAPIDNQSIVLDFTATLIVTVNVDISVNGGETVPQEPDFAFSLSGLLGYRTESYNYMVPKAPTYIATQATITKYIPNVSPGTYTIDFIIRKLNSTGSCGYSNAQVIIQAIPQ